MPNPQKWGQGDKVKAFAIANELGLRQMDTGCNSCSIKVVNFLRDYIGYPMLNNEEPNHKDRLAICKQCPSLIRGVTCKECYCFVAIKTRFKNQVCPLNKW